MPSHIVEQGECLTGIAALYGFRNFRTIYDHPGNTALRTARPDPNLLFPGDTVFIPEKTHKEASVPTTKRHRFQISAPRRLLRIVLEGLDGRTLAGEPYELDIEGAVTQGVTGADGLIEHAIPLDAVNGTLTTARYSWPLSVAHLNPLTETHDSGIAAIQARLRNMGYDPGPIDGINGPRTIDAVKTFQEDNPPLTVDGVCGPKTRALLLQLYGC
jgi:N-acetylmuramoyl-L-alanine amidase